eukprot:TRINITY_DN14653_c0_g2_i2.p1 TRINITY_DN14653_c0_g2~~TRINITY_DN14653_c0_g2_i2.p1  ORF type:complete len:521 (+),score=109.85 TRINITY_DN14653_c0_g2_i2:866-2428(+)
MALEDCHLPQLERAATNAFTKRADMDSLVPDMKDLQGSGGEDDEDDIFQMRLNKIEEARHMNRPRTLRDWLASTQFDTYVSVLVCLNVVLMFLQLQEMGYEASVELELRKDAGGTWNSLGPIFSLLEHFFNILFVIELCLRLYLLRCKYFKVLYNLIDMSIVLTTCAEAYVFPYLGSLDGDGLNVNVARMARLFKLVKCLRAFRVAALFSELRVLMNTLTSSMMALSWSAVLLGLIILASGILMAQLCLPFVSDESLDYELRVWVWRYFGSAARATYTMFEVTLSGCWPNYARPLIENVSSLFALFWVSYVILVVFAVIRIVSALFLTNTMKVAADDEEMMVQNKWKERDKYLGKLRRFFKMADTDGNGTLDKVEFDRMLDDPQISSWLTILGLEMHEIFSLFSVLDDGDGVISYEEFIGGCMRLKGNARAIDTVLLMHEQFKLNDAISELGTQLEQFAGGASRSVPAELKRPGSSMFRNMLKTDMTTATPAKSKSGLNENAASGGQTSGMAMTRRASSP